jgi:transcriptional regulator with XRE-family HTH domain
MGVHIENSYRTDTLHWMKGRSDKADAQRGERIRARRKALKMNQDDLAALIGVDQSTVSDIERGASFSAELLIRMSEALGYSPVLIMRGEDATFWPFQVISLDDFLMLEDRARGYIEGVLSRELEKLSPAPTEEDVKRLDAALGATAKRTSRRKAA